MGPITEENGLVSPIVHPVFRIWNPFFFESSFPVAVTYLKGLYNNS